MAYTKQNFENGKVLTAEQLNQMDAGILEASQKAESLMQAKENGELDGKDGADGKNGQDGNDGVSPAVSVEPITDGYRITITDANGSNTFDVMNGTDGRDGSDGKDGTDGVNGKDGQPGADGKDGYTPVKNRDYFDGEDGQDGNGIASAVLNADYTLTLTFTDGTKYTTPSLRGAPGVDGNNGKDGSPGKDGIDGKDYVLTEADKTEIAAMVIEMLGGNPVFGYVDKNNNILVSGNLPDGTYSVKYEMEDGSTVNIGNLVLDTNVYYSVTNNLTNCTSNNSDAQAIGGQPYSATISAKSGYELKSVTVTMGGQAVSVNGGNISIAAVTGNIVITAVAEEIKEKYTNLADPASADWKEGYRLNSSAAPTNSNIVTGSVVTNFIGPIKQGDVIRVQGIYLNQGGHMSPAYKTDKSVSSDGSALLSAYGNTTCATNVTVTDTGAQFTVGSKDQIQNGYWRFSGVLVKTSADVIITINEEIV